MKKFTSSVLLFGTCLSNASGALTFTMEEVGADVVVSTTGTLVNPLAESGDSGDSSDFDSTAPGNIGAMTPFVGSLSVGSVQDIGAGFFITVFYENVIVSGPSGFGPGFPAGATTGSGNYIGIVASGGSIAMDGGIRGGSSLTGGTATWENATLASLGAVPGVYTWTLNSRFNGDTVTINVVPEPGSTGLLMLGGCLGLFRRRK